MERRIRQEDCNEDSLGSGILTLTDRRIVFEKTVSRIMDFSKRTGEAVLDVPLAEVGNPTKEGVFTRKACFEAGGKKYKFGVFRAGAWIDDIEDAISSLS